MEPTPPSGVSGTPAAAPGSSGAGEPSASSPGEAMAQTWAYPMMQSPQPQQATGYMMPSPGIMSPAMVPMVQQPAE